jgi:hypothetical protein
MKAIYMGLFLVGLASLTLGCSVAPQGPAGEAREMGDGSVVEAADQAASRLPLVRCGFAVRDFRVIRDEYGRVHAVGEVENVGDATRGVELQAALRDAEGRLLSVGHFCPAGGSNIMPGEVWPFTYSFGRQDGGVHAELRIVDAFRSMSGPDTVANAR